MNKNDLKIMSGILFQWRKNLYEQNNRGARAELRRSKTVLDVIMTPSYQYLCNDVARKVNNFNKWDKERLAFISGLLSHVREVNDIQLATAMSKGSTACISELRFRRLLQNEYDDRFYHTMIRVIRMLKYHINVYQFIEDMYYWNDNTKKKWAYDYFS